MNKKPPRNIYIRCNDAVHAASFIHAQVTILDSIPIPIKGEVVKYTDLSQLWHDKDERPDFDFDRILVNEEDGSLFAYDNADVFGISDPGGVYADSSWQEFVENFGVRCWAYAEDLMPSDKEKGGGNG